MFHTLTSFHHLFQSYQAAAKGKRGLPEVAHFELDLENHLLHIKEQLAQHKWAHKPYSSFEIHDPKRRLVSAAAFEDRVVHHALVRVIEPLFEAVFLPHSFANRKGKGTHRAIAKAKGHAQEQPFVLQCDLKQFFASVDHEILMHLLAQRISCERTLELAKNILQSGNGILHERYDMVHFEGDDLFAANRPRGLPIGNLTSQFWANVLLYELDDFVVNQLGCDAYVRYVDDFLLFSNDKKQLWRFKTAIREKLASLRLAMHEASSTVYPVKNGIPFLGMRVWPETVKLKSRNARAFESRLRKMQKAVAAGQMSLAEVQTRIAGWVAHASQANSWALRRDIFKNTASQPPSIQANPPILESTDENPYQYHASRPRPPAAPAPRPLKHPCSAKPTICSIGSRQSPSNSRAASASSAPPPCSKPAKSF
ncbi:MAG: RNA-dependent DNA polymerase [Brachymonas sp.]|nr:RNA-dependent DNA polymerase [Brachymonas sp.]